MPLKSKSKPLPPFTAGTNTAKTKKAEEAELLRQKEEAKRRAAEITARLRLHQYGGEGDEDEQSAGVGDVEDFSLGGKVPPLSESDGDFLDQDNESDKEENDIMEVDDRDDLMGARAMKGKKKLSQRERGREFWKQLEGSERPHDQDLSTRKCGLSTSDTPSSAKKLKSTRNIALKTGGITKNWQSRARESQSSQGEDSSGLGGLPTEEEREGLDQEVRAAAMVRSGQAKLARAKTRNIQETDVVVEEKDVYNGKKKGGRGKSERARGQRYGNQHLLLSPDDLQAYQTEFLSTLISFVGTQKDVWSSGTSKPFVDFLQSCYQSFFPDVIKQRPALLPITIRSPEYIVTTQRIRSWRNKIGTTAIAEVRKFFRNWTRRISDTKNPSPVPPNIDETTPATQTVATTNNTAAPTAPLEADPVTADTQSGTITQSDSVAENDDDQPQGEQENKPGDAEVPGQSDGENNSPKSHDLDTAEGRENYVRMMLDKSTHLFLYRDPKNRKGAFESEIILRTFAAHYPHYVALKWDYEEPQTGALALATTAVFRALEAWKDGHEDRATEFSTGKWQNKTAMYFAKASLLSESAWDRITTAAETYSKFGSKGRHSATLVDDEDNKPEGSEDMDGAGIVVDSD
ncbi:hypothetical protein AAF712_004832 [Marasmius tenuissimus]|uniref:DUF6532 domain-containing protein n=1 Tax=Marasmius tenuissimus TaxID=585030 RepID=A0ABR3A6K7_9AGAR